MSPRRFALLVATDEYAEPTLSRLPSVNTDSERLSAVLSDPRVGGYGVRLLKNEPSYHANAVVEEFFTEARFDDLLLLYISGHGLKDDHGRLYFASKNTRRERLGSSAVSSAFIHEQMAKSRSRRILVILDCCFSGAFSVSGRRRAAEQADAIERLSGRGRAILTSSTALQYSFESPPPEGDVTDPLPSVFSGVLIDGLHTGEADLNADGLIDVGELYEYVYRGVRRKTAHQTPMLSSELEGPFYVAFSSPERRSPLAASPFSSPSPVPPSDADTDTDTDSGTDSDSDSGGRADPSEQSAEDALSVRLTPDGLMELSIGRRQFLMGSALLIQPRLVSPESSLSSENQGGRWAIDFSPFGDDPYRFAHFIRAHWPDVIISRSLSPQESDWMLTLPGGNAFGGAMLAAQMHGRLGADDGLSTVGDGNPRRVTRFVGASYRGLLVAAETSGETPRFFALGKHEARRQLNSGLNDLRSVRIPSAYELDDLTYGVLWAAANLDDALQEDEIPLAENRRRLRSYGSLPSSAVSREVVGDLTKVSQMWLGSDFCAQYIMNQLKTWNDVPSYWTREKSGEEACMWLLIQHKYEYLRKTGRRFAGSPTPSMRAFCIPESEVGDASAAHRTLIFLAIALMEMLKIQVRVCVDPAYTEVEGFVLAPRRQGMIANWVRGQGIWHVDTVGRRSDVAGFGDAVTYATAYSVAAGETAPQRLRSLAEYLDLDWPWLRHRCGELGRAGWRGLVQPRSRLLGTGALDAVCGYVGELPE